MPTIDAGASGASTVSSGISLIKTIIGAGLLSMPLAFSTDGIAIGIVIILLAALTSGYGLFLQAYTSKYVPLGHATFFNLCSVSYPTLSVVFDIAIAIQCFGCALSYLVLIGDISPTFVTYVPYVDPVNYRTFWILVSTLICVPLSFLKNLDNLKYTSILGLVAILYMSLLVIGHFLTNDIPNEYKGDITYFPPTISGIFSTFSIIVFAFTGHQNMFSIINEAKDKSLSNISKLINFAIILSSIFFIIVGLAGYLTFGDKVTGNVILSYPQAWYNNLGRFSIVFMVIFSFPLMIHPARISVNNIYYFISVNVFDHQIVDDDDDIIIATISNENTSLLPNVDSQESQIASKKSNVVPLPHKTFLVITTALLLLGYGLAISITSFAFVLAIVGATGSTAISFILPGLFGFKLIGSESQNPTLKEIILKQLSLALTIWGIAVMLLCLYTTIFLSQV
ncbi:vacuolar amino acid transporter 7 [Scheffersomyces coipomensis]|uniref:vacuolar amino acid transporter 7 n=1 Tax=Scheffersomyces coipomensis TaxID=1788519 RepID=UPI00315CB767